MASHKSDINVGIKFNADTSQAQQQIQALQASLNKVSMAGSGKGISAEMQRAAVAAQQLQMHLQKAYNSKTGNLDLSLLNRSLTSTKSNINELSTALYKSGADGQAAFVNLAKSIANANQPMLKTNALLNQMLSTLGNTLRWEISSRILHGFGRSIQQAYSYSKNLNKSLTDIRIVTGYSADRMADFAIEANKAARALSATTKEYTDASLIYFQQGLNDQQVKERTDITIKMANVTRESAQTVSDQMTAVWNNFDDGSKSLEYYSDVLTALGAATASSTAEITEGLEKFAAVAETVGLSYEYASAALTTITSNTRQSASEVGTALKTLLSRIQGLKLGETLDDGTDLNKYSKALDAVGISIKDQNGQLKAMDDLLDEMAAKWKTLNNDQQVALAQTVAGVRQYTQLIALMENWSGSDNDNMLANLKTASGAEGSLQKQADIYAESWEAARDRATAALEDIYGTLFDSEFFIKLTDSFTHITTGIGGFLKGIDGMKGILTGVAGILLTNFAHKIPTALQDSLYNIKVLFGGAKKEAIAFQGTMNEVFAKAKADASFSNSQKVELAAAQNLMNARNEYAKISSKLSASETQFAEIRLNALEAEQKQWVELAQSVENYQAILRQKETSIAGSNLEYQLNKGSEKAWNSQNTLNFDTYSEALEILQKKILNTANEAKNALREALLEGTKVDMDKILQPLVEGFNKVKNLVSQSDSAEIFNGYKQALLDFANALPMSIKKTDGFAEALQRLKESSFETKEEAVKAFDSITKAFKNLDPKEMEKYRDVLESLITKVFGSSKVAQFKDEIEGLREATKKLADAPERAKAAYESFINGLKHIPGTIESISKAAGGLSSFAMSLNGFKSAWEALKNPDLSGFEKFISISMSLGWAIGGLNSSLNTFKTLVTGMPLVIAANTAAEEYSIAVKNKALAIDNVRKINLIKEKYDKKELTELEAKRQILELLGIKISKEASEDDVRRIFLEETKNKEVKKGIHLSEKNSAKKLEEVATSKLSTAAAEKEALAKEAVDKANKKLIISSSLLAVGVVALIAIIALLVKHYKEMQEASPEGQLKSVTEATEKLTEAANNAKESFEKLKTTVSDWTEAKDSLAELEKGTEEYNKALDDANEKARELIKAYNLYGQWEYKNGVIEIDPEALETTEEIYKDRQKRADTQKTASLISQKYWQGQDESHKAFSDNATFMVDINSDIGQRYRDNDSSYGSAVVTNTNDLETQQVTIYEKQLNELAEVLAEELDPQQIKDLRLHETYAEFAEAFNLDSSELTDEMKLNLEALFLEGNEKLLDEVFSVTEQFEHIELASAELVDELLIQKYRLEYGDDIQGDAGRVSQVLGALTGVTEGKEDVIAGLEINDSTINGSGDLRDYYEENGYEAFGNTDKDLYEEYLKQVLGYTEGEINNFVYDATNKKFLDASGETIADLSSISVEAASKLIYRSLEVEKSLKAAELDETYGQNVIDIANKYSDPSQEGYYTTSALLDAIASGGLTDEEKAGKIDISSILGTISDLDYEALEKDPNKIWNILGMTPKDAENMGFDLGAGFAENVREAILAEWSEENYLANAMSQGVANAEAAGFEPDVYEAFFKTFKEGHKDLKITEEQMHELALVSMQCQAGIQEIAKNWDDWQEALKNPGTSEAAEAQAKFNEALAKVANINKDVIKTLPKDFAKKYKKEIEAVIKGEEGAVQKLQELILNDLNFEDIDFSDILSFDIQDIETDAKRIFDIIKDLDMSTIEVGANIDNEQFIQACNEMLRAGKMTGEQMAEYLKMFGFNAVVNTEKVPLSVAVNDGYITEEQANNLGRKFITEVEVPSVKVITYDGSSYGGNIDRTEDSGGGGSESSAEPLEYEDEIERYHENTRQIERLTRALEKVSTAKDRAFGKHRLALIDDEIEATEALVQQQRALLAETREYLKQDFAEIQQYGFIYDEFGELTNYDEVMKEQIDKYNAVVATGNADAIEAAKKEYEEFKENMEQYEETLTQYEEAQAQLQEYINQVVDLKLEKITTEVEIKILVNDKELTRLEYLLRKIEYEGKGAADAIALMGRQFEQISEKAKPIQEAIDKIYEQARAEGRGLLEEEVKEIKSFYQDGVISSEEEKRIKEIYDKAASEDRMLTQAEEEQIQEYKEQLLELNQEVMDIVETIEGKFIETIEELNGKVDESIGRFATYTGMFQTLSDVITLSGKAGSKYGMDMLNTLSARTVANASTAMRSNLRSYEALDQIYKEEQANLERAIKTGDERLIKQYQDRLHEVEMMRETSYESMLSSWSEALQAANDLFDTKLTNMVTSLKQNLGDIDKLIEIYDRAVELEDLYVSGNKSIYELSKLARDVGKDIDKTANIIAKNKLTGLLEQINKLRSEGVKLSQYDLEYWQAKYELEVAEIALQEAQEAKAQVKLTRNTAGGWGYTYVADAEAISEAQQNYEDSLYNMQELHDEYIRDYSERLIKNRQDLVNALQDLDKTSLTFEEDALRLKEHHFKQEEYLIDELNKAYQRAGVSYQDTLLAQTYGGASLEDSHTNFINSVVKMIQDELLPGYQEFQESVDGINSQAGTTVEDAMDKIFESSITMEDEVIKNINDLTSGVKEVSDEIWNFQETYGEAISKMLADNEEYYSKTIKMYQNFMAETEADKWLQYFDDMRGPGEVLGVAGSGAAGAMAGNGSTAVTNGAFGDMMNALSSTGSSRGKGTVNVFGGGSSSRGEGVHLRDDGTYGGIASIQAGEEQIPEAAMRALRDDPALEGMNLNSYAGDDGSLSASELKKLFNDKGVDYTDYIHDNDDVQRFGITLATGGYTGSWGSEGRLAILHEKELVLNKYDTENMLDMVNTLRDIDWRAKLSELWTNIEEHFIAPIFGGGDNLQQDVRIEASFPGVSNHTEIEEAFNNLINTASQYANRKRY